MTVRQLITKLERLPKKMPVYVESAPWGIPFEAEIVKETQVVESNTKKKKLRVIMIEHNVGM